MTSLQRRELGQVYLMGGVRRVPVSHGSLEKIQELPLELLYEILCWLEPYDLLRLSWTTKQLRKILMSQSATFIWESARMNIGLHSILPFMSEPAFANLLFNPHCHVCGRSSTRMQAIQLHFPQGSPANIANIGRNEIQVYMISAAEALHKEFSQLQEDEVLDWAKQKYRIRIKMGEASRSSQVTIALFSRPSQVAGECATWELARLDTILDSIRREDDRRLRSAPFPAKFAWLVKTMVLNLWTLAKRSVPDKIGAIYRKIDQRIALCLITIAPFLQAIILFVVIVWKIKWQIPFLLARFAVRKVIGIDFLRWVP
ncbi:hypothetical protein WG66_008848 [Moniliophthora roreri]|nr:hypothetical protein WG66_008848 [Moniliophthora roreri]